MIVKNMCEKMDSSLLALLIKWAEADIDAEELIIQPNGNVDLLCSCGYICHNYAPTIVELLRYERSYVYED